MYPFVDMVCSSIIHLFVSACVCLSLSVCVSAYACLSQCAKLWVHSHQHHHSCQRIPTRKFDQLVTLDRGPRMMADATDANDERDSASGDHAHPIVSRTCADDYPDCPLSHALSLSLSLSLHLSLSLSLFISLSFVLFREL